MEERLRPVVGYAVIAYNIGHPKDYGVVIRICTTEKQAEELMEELRKETNTDELYMIVEV